MRKKETFAVVKKGEKDKPGTMVAVISAWGG